MPPVGFWAAATSSYTSASGAVTFLTPAAVRENDVLLAVIAVPTGAFAMPSGWSQLAALAGGNAAIYVCRRIAVADEPSVHVFTCNTAMSPQPLGVLLLERGLDPAAALVASAFANVNPAATAYPAPTINLATYSDLGLLAYYANDAAGTDTFAMPGGANQRAIVHGSAGGGTLVIADYLQGATGATGAKSAAAGSAAIGVAVNLAIKANPTIPAPALVPDIPGALGFATVGV